MRRGGRRSHRAGGGVPAAQPHRHPGLGSRAGGVPVLDSAAGGGDSRRGLRRVLVADAVDVHDLIRRYPNLLVLRTFSKAFGLAGLRIGYAFGADELVARVRRRQLPFGMSCAAVAAVSASYAAEDELRARVARITAEREWLRNRLQQHGTSGASQPRQLPLPERARRAATHCSAAASSPSPTPTAAPASRSATPPPAARCCRRCGRHEHRSMSMTLSARFAVECGRDRYCSHAHRRSRSRSLPAVAARPRRRPVRGAVSRFRRRSCSPGIPRVPATSFVRLSTWSNPRRRIR